MKTLTRTIILIVALSLLAAVVAQAQTGQPVEPVLSSEPTPAPTPTPPTTPTPGLPIPPSPTPTEPTPPTPPTIPTSTSVGNVDNVFYNMTGVSSVSRFGNTGTVLVIPSEQTRTEDLLAINEDMNVMSLIFEKNLEQDRITTVHSSIFVSRSDVILPLLGRSRGRIQSMYLQGFGALFLMNVDFPLTPPSDVQKEEKETQKVEQGDPVWRKMRQEMFEPEKVDRRRRTDRPEERYDSERVENLKTTLIKALKHAANIRSLKPDESVILTVIGRGEPTGTTIAAARVIPGKNQIIILQKNADGRTKERIVQGNSLDVLDDIGLSSPAVLVIRTKRSDIDEFAKGDLDFEKFRQRVQLLTYPLLGGADGHGTHFSPYMNLRSTGSSNIHR